MSVVFFVVVAEEDDYYPDIRPIGVFDSEDAAQAYIAKQPKYVYPWADHVSAGYRNMKRAYSYEVQRVEFEPSEPWAKVAE